MSLWHLLSTFLKITQNQPNWIYSELSTTADVRFFDVINGNTETNLRVHYAMICHLLRTLCSNLICFSPPSSSCMSKHGKPGKIPSIGKRIALLANESVNREGGSSWTELNVHAWRLTLFGVTHWQFQNKTKRYYCSNLTFLKGQICIKKPLSKRRANFKALIDYAATTPVGCGATCRKRALVWWRKVLQKWI